MIKDHEVTLLDGFCSKIHIYKGCITVMVSHGEVEANLSLCGKFRPELPHKYKGTFEQVTCGTCRKIFKASNGGPIDEH